MLGRVKSSWRWFVDGLAEALLLTVERARPRRLILVDLGEGGASVRTAKGETVGRLVEDAGAARFEPAGSAARLAGAAVDVRLPSSWLFRRDLDSVAAQSSPFLDAFVRHQIDRITPWRVADVHYQIFRKPLPGDPTRLAVSIGVVPKRLVQAWLAAVQATGPARLRLVVVSSASPDGDVVIALGDEAAMRLDRWRRRVTIGLSALALAVSGALGLIWWAAGDVRAQIEDQDRLAEERNAVLARARQREQAAHEVDAKLRDLRASRSKAAETLDALAAALPDTAYLTALALDKDRLTVSGVSTDLPALVPALENSRLFAGVTYSAATTRVETGTGDRFHLEMRLVGPVKANTAP